MPNDNTAVCGCGVVLDLPKSRNGMTASSLTILNPKPSKGSKGEGKSSKKQTEEGGGGGGGRGPISRASDTGSTSSVAEQTRPAKNIHKHEKRLNPSRRTRSAERVESHYTYIDSGSSIFGGSIRENAIPEALYATIEDPPNASANGNAGSQQNAQNRPQPVYVLPSMTSPPPTYDVATGKSWQGGLPPSYEEYLCHNYPMISRSHTPPPPWSDSTVGIQQARRDLFASQSELTEYLTQLTLVQANQDQVSHQFPLVRHSTTVNQQALRKQAMRTQRARAMPPRSQSESRAQQQRISTMYDDAAFCMETTAIQSAIDNGVAFCSLM
ncbi:uncharacterized protein LOC122503807 [Leptopilina heterotoma]|uniref:uncharacterized protein LOC122503807 n=1 Tax=Leptopilina heterotoma TaxID=63436 RepID=UPI001CA829CB|nr:uncharacterized protein LOC122503807 [Leptopilina heterotoma]